MCLGIRRINMHSTRYLLLPAVRTNVLSLILSQADVEKKLMCGLLRVNCTNMWKFIGTSISFLHCNLQKFVD